MSNDEKHDSSSNAAASASPSKTIDDEGGGGGHDNKEPSTLAWVSRLFSSSSFRQTLDEQRLERLQQCQSLAQVLHACRTKQSNRPQLEDFPMGIRSVRYFQWRHEPHDDDHDDDHYGEKTKQRAAAETSCIREEHALWACRAVALKCGQQLVALRDCFGEHTADELLSQDKTAYDCRISSGAGGGGNGSSDMGNVVRDSPTLPNVPCAAFQDALGVCVAKNVKALSERQKQWKKQQQESSN